MKFDLSNLNLDSPDAWLILLTYLGFSLYSYYSLVIFLIHLHQKNRLYRNY